MAASLMLVPAIASQIGPVGSSFESRLTNETPSRLTDIAGRLGVLIKAPVHEEITQLGFSCSVELAAFSGDKVCGSADAGFANHFVIYGVRWNDLPPFRLSPDEGRNCSYLGQSICRTDQTIRFATQPLCWYCLFKNAEKVAATKKITGCAKGAEFVTGNLMTRSHFGDLQFLHGMASAEGEDPKRTQANILGWIEFAWKVASKEIKADAFLKDVAIPTMQEHFGCSEWRVSDLYILGRQEGKTGLIQQIHQIAFGSILHTVQDSFAGAHTSRESQQRAEICTGSGFERPPRVVEFHTYGAQDGSLHDDHDSRDALVAQRGEDAWPQAVLATRNLVDLFQSGAKWADAQSYVRCLFDTVDQPKPASPGDAFKKTSAQ
jgi:hypothetical protein